MPQIGRASLSWLECYSSVYTGPHPPVLESVPALYAPPGACIRARTQDVEFPAADETFCVVACFRASLSSPSMRAGEGLHVHRMYMNRPNFHRLHRRSKPRHERSACLRKGMGSRSISLAERSRWSVVVAEEREVQKEGPRRTCARCVGNPKPRRGGGFACAFLGLSIL